jgi:signal peptidase I
VARVLLIMLMTIVASLAAWAVLPLVWGWDAYTVMSGSMAPLVRPGDVVVAGPAAHPDRLKAGTVAVLAPFRPGGPPVTHRIVDRLADGSYRTQGDANPVPDARLSRPDQIVGRARIVVPLVGLPQLRLGGLAPGAGLALIAVSVSGPVLRRRRGRDRLGRTARRRRGPGGAHRRRRGGGHRLGALTVAGLVTVARGAAATTQAAWTARSSPPANSWATSAFYYPTMIASAPVSYWRMGGATTTVTDEMGVAALTLNNGPTLQRPGALRGDPNPSTGFTHASTNPTYGTVTNAAHNITGSMSVAAWTNAAGGSLYRLVFKGTSTQNTLNYLLAWDSTGTHMRFLTDQPATSSRSTAIQPGAWPRDGLWHFVVGVYDGSLVRLYIDGTQVASAAASGALATTAAALTVSENSGNSLGGDVDEVAVWNRALSGTEISTLYSIGIQ